MTYRILIYNHHPLVAFNPEALLPELKSAHYATLCRQYGLDTALIAPALAQIALEVPAGGQAPYFLLRYSAKQHPPLVVSRWAGSELGSYPGSTGEDGQVVPPAVQAHLARVSEGYSVTLVPAQLFDLGLVLAYEIARWVAFRGSGLVLGLDGAWYRLNVHQAFIPLNLDG